VQASPELANKHLVSDQLWNRLVGRIVKDEDMELSLAERIMDQALGFLKLISLTPGQSFGPSPLVDIGWHTFILYTRDYAAFCEKVAGYFIHHSPFDEEGVDYGTGHIPRTVAAMKAHGIVVDEDLWVGIHRECGDGPSACDSEGSCG
jgi:hypothetical protein